MEAIVFGGTGWVGHSIAAEFHVDELLRKYAKSISEIGLRFLATHMSFDIRKAREQLGYEPHCTTKDAIRETALWAAEQTAR